MELGNFRKTNINNLKFLYWILKNKISKRTFHLNSSEQIHFSLTFNKSHIKVISRKSNSDLDTISEIFLNELYRLPKEIRTIKTIVDLGSNAGFSALYFQSLFPHAKIFCVEPLAENVELINLNCQQNNFEWVIEQACITDDSQDFVDFYSSEWWSSGSMIEKIGVTRQSDNDRFENKLKLPTRKVKSITLNQLMEKYEISFIDILKVDIEGAEELLFCAEADWIDKVGILLIEIHDKYIDGEVVRQVINDRFFCYESKNGVDMFMSKKYYGGINYAKQS